MRDGDLVGTWQSSVNPGLPGSSPLVWVVLLAARDGQEPPKTHHGGDKDDFSGTLKSVFDWELCSTSGFPWEIQKSLSQLMIEDLSGLDISRMGEEEREEATYIVNDIIISLEELMDLL